MARGPDQTVTNHHAIIVGAGVAGASTAFALARRGVRVTLIESELTGQATAAGAGIIEPWSTSRGADFYGLYSLGAQYYPTLLERLAPTNAAEIGYRRSGALIVNADTDKLDEVEARLSQRFIDAPEIGTVSRLVNAEARELFPPLAEGLCALHISGAARVDGGKLRVGLLEAAKRNGTIIMTGTARLEPSSYGRPSVRVGETVVEGDSIILAAGAWTNTLLKPLKVGLPMGPQRGQITHLRLEGVDTAGWPSVHPSTSHYLVAFDDSRIVVGATRENGSGFDARVTAEGQRQILENALAVAPGLAPATLIETRVGLRPMPDDERPFLGAVQGYPGLFLNAGFGALGLTMAPVVGELLADLVLEEQADHKTASLLEAFAPGNRLIAARSYSFHRLENQQRWSGLSGFL